MFASHEEIVLYFVLYRLNLEAYINLEVCCCFVRLHAEQLIFKPINEKHENGFQIVQVSIALLAELVCCLRHIHHLTGSHHHC